MTALSSSGRLRPLAAITAIVFLSFLSSLLPTAVAAGSQCSASKQQYACPNCGGTYVTDCTDCQGYMFADRDHEICYDRKLFHSTPETGDHDDHYPFLWNDIVGTIVFFLTAGVATACGVGGGGIYVPMGILLMRFPPKAASGLSQASIFGASLGGILVNIRKHHPDEYIRDTKGTPLEDCPGKIVSYEKDKGPGEIEEDRRRYLEGGDGQRRFYTRPVVDYDMALFLAPMEMAGAVLGVLIQRLLPNWLYLGLAAIILGFTCYKTTKKFLAQQRRDKVERADRARATENEKAAMAAMAAAATADSDLDAEAVASGGFVEMTEMGTTTSVKSTSFNAGTDDNPKDLEMRRKFLTEDARQYPAEKIACLLFLWAGLTIITFLKGGKGVDSVIGITCEDAGFYILIGAQFLWTLGFAAVFGYRNVKKTQERLEVHYPFNQSDVLWDAHKLRFYSFFTFVAGIVAGLIGIGGGMVLGPLMLVMGINPRVSTATTATMILLTSSSVAVMFVMSGLVPWEYALYFFCVCLLGAYIGKTRVDAHIRKTGMASVLVGALAAIIGLATVGCVVILLMNLAKAGWCLEGFKPFCSVSAEEGGCQARRLLGIAKEVFTLTN